VSNDSDSPEAEDHDEEDADDSAEISMVLPTSDDPLNLFALPSSSPRVRLVNHQTQGAEADSGSHNEGIRMATRKLVVLISIRTSVCEK